MIARPGWLVPALLLATGYGLAAQVTEQRLLRFRCFSSRTTFHPRLRFFAVPALTRT